MDSQTLIALLSFSVVNFFTPGPNNLMLMTSGVNFGVARTIPHLTGVVLGFPAMTVAVGIGLSGLFTAVPAARTVLTIFSVVYTLWLAWKIARSAPPDPNKAPGKPLGFWQAIAFQWVNPKAWSMALTAVTLFAPRQNVAAVMMIGGIFVLVGCFSSTGWMLLGSGVSGWLSDPRRLRIFNIAMALLLVASIALAL